MHWKTLKWNCTECFNFWKKILPLIRGLQAVKWDLKSRFFRIKIFSVVVAKSDYWANICKILFVVCYFVGFIFLEITNNSLQRFTVNEQEDSNLCFNILFNPHLRGCVHIWYSNFKWLFLLKFLCTKILKQLVLPFQSIVFIHMFLNLWHNYAFISFKVHFLNSEIEYHICTQGVA